MMIPSLSPYMAGLLLLAPALVLSQRDDGLGNSVEFPLLATSSPDTCPTTKCGAVSSEPLNPEVRALRTSSCTLPTSRVEAVLPGAPSNPPNVRTVEQFLPEARFR